MIHKVLKYPDPLLRRRSQDVFDFGEKLQELVTDLKDTLAHHRALGISAPQIGSPYRVIVIATEKAPQVLINPRIEGAEDPQFDREGCLSFPMAFARIARPTWLKVLACTVEGEILTYTFDDQQARAVAHEIDHLDGKLMIDLLTPEYRDRVLLDAVVAQQRAKKGKPGNIRYAAKKQ